MRYFAIGMLVWTLLPAAGGTLAQVTPAGVEAAAEASGTPLAEPAESATQPAEAVQPGKKFSPWPVPDYRGDLRTRARLTGDWGGLRMKLAENGITFEDDLLQLMQGNAAGGRNTNEAIRYGGNNDFTLKLDTGRMGLWPGGLITLRGETQIGQSINPQVGAAMPVDYVMLLPTPRDPGVTAFSEWFLTQALCKELVFVAGKIDPARLGDLNVFAGDYKTQFSNTAFYRNPVVFQEAPYTMLAAAGIYMPTDWLTLRGAVGDTNSRATITGFHTAFHEPRGATVAQETDLNIKPFGLTGHQRFGWAWSNKEFPRMEDVVRLTINRSGQLPTTLGGKPRPDDWAIYYNFDQYFYQEKCDPTQGVGVFGRYGHSTGEANPAENFYSLGIGGKGVIPQRDQDNFGVGFYCLQLSNDLPAFLNENNEEGVELFYNIEITPWLHITPDLQVIVSPGGMTGPRERDPAIVYGLRAVINF